MPRKTDDQAATTVPLGCHQRKHGAWADGQSNGLRVVIAGDRAEPQNQIKFVGRQHGALHDFLDAFPGVWLVFGQSQPQKMRGIEVECFGDGANAVQRDFCGARFEHGDDVWIVKAALVGDLALGFVRLGQAICDEIANSSLGM